MVSRMRVLLTVPLVTFLASQAAAHVELHGPRDRFWRHNRDDRILEIDGVNRYDDIEKCIHDTMTQEDYQSMKTEMATEQNITHMYMDDEEEWVFLVSVQNAILPSHAAAVRALASCVRRYIPGSYEARSMSIEMGYDHDVGLGGNCPTHLAPLVGLFLPQVFEDMERLLNKVYTAAGWNEYLPNRPFFHQYNLLPEPKDVGFRASEHLTYDEFKEGLKDHTDGSDTKYTFNYAFVPPDSYGGGEFYIKYGDNERLVLKPKQYEAMIFLGGYYPHGVLPITHGRREMFSSEFWTYPDAPFGSNLWSNTGDRMSRYIDYCNREEDEKGNKLPCQVDFTTFNMEEEWDTDDEDRGDREEDWDEEDWDEEDWDEEDWDEGESWDEGEGWDEEKEEEEEYEKESEEATGPSMMETESLQNECASGNGPPNVDTTGSIEVGSQTQVLS